MVSLGLVQISLWCLPAIPSTFRVFHMHDRCSDSTERGIILNQMGTPQLRPRSISVMWTQIQCSHALCSKNYFRTMTSSFLLRCSSYFRHRSRYSSHYPSGCLYCPYVLRPTLPLHHPWRQTRSQASNLQQHHNQMAACWDSTGSMAVAGHRRDRRCLLPIHHHHRHRRPSLVDCRLLRRQRAVVPSLRMRSTPSIAQRR